LDIVLIEVGTDKFNKIVQKGNYSAM